MPGVGRGVYGSRVITRAALICSFLIASLAPEVHAQSVPSPWNGRDVGSPATAGSSSSSDGQNFHLAGAGSDIWGSSDQFHFVYQAITGDVEVIARVDSIAQAHVWSKAGVMIRASLNADASHGFAFVSAAKGVGFQRRLVAGGQTTHSGGTGAAPVWVKLVRVGTRVTAHVSTNATSWTTIGSGSLALGSTAYVGLAVTSHNTSLAAKALASNVAIRPLSLPSPLQSRDIGSTGATGGASYSSSSFRVSGAGADIWDTQDQFHYVYQPVTGDVDVRVRVNSVEQVDYWSKGGVMIRESLTAGSRHAIALVSAAKGYAFQRRVQTDDYSDHTAGGSGAAPGWLRLVRTGTQFEAFRSTDGITWQSMGTDAIPMGETVYVGMAVTSHVTGETADAVFDNFRVTAQAPTTGQPPTVALTSPSNAATFTAPATISVAANASDADGQVARVEFFADNTPIGTDSSSPFAVSWSSVPAGSYSLRAIAYDDDGLSTTSSVVSITVSSTANQAPSVTITAPANGATYTAPASFTVTASASDPDGQLARVEFYRNGTLIGTDTSSPYSVGVSSLAAGSYSFTAIAYDTAGASRTSAAVGVSVTTSTNQAPSVSITSPANGATFTAPASFTVTASASDPEGQLARVEFYRNGTLIFTDTSSPYSVGVSSLAAGSYSFTAIAYDGAGLSRTSAAVSVTVGSSTTTAPRYVAFTASTDHSVVTRYVLEVFASGANPATATAIATSDLAKPTPDASNDITVDRATFFSALAAGNYVATVRAENGSGFSRSTAVSFTR